MLQLFIARIQVFKELSSSNSYRHCCLATSYSPGPSTSTIGAEELNGRVRNGTGVSPPPSSPETDAEINVYAPLKLNSECVAVNSIERR